MNCDIKTAVHMKCWVYIGGGVLRHAFLNVYRSRNGGCEGVEFKVQGEHLRVNEHTMSIEKILGENRRRRPLGTV